MCGVDAVDGSLRAALGVIGLVLCDLQVAQHIDVNCCLVGRNQGAHVDAAAKRLHRALARHDTAPRHLEEGRVGVADARHDANLLAGEASSVDLFAAIPCLLRQLEGTFGVVALE